MKKIFLFAALFLFFNVSTFAQTDLPSVIVTTLDGKKVNLADYGKSGKNLVISFWATWCGPCKKELNNMTELYDTWKTKYNVEVIAISIDDQRNVPKVSSYVKSQQWAYTVLVDSNQDLKRALNFQSVPYTLLVNKQGKIVYKHTSYVDGDEDLLDQKIKALK
jgi:thiol-disulfide isomerase/thioredoxin